VIVDRECDATFSYVKLTYLSVIRNTRKG